MTTPDISTPEPIIKRTTFLLVICILTFICSGWELISSTRNYFTADIISGAATGAIQKAKEQMDSPNTPAFLKKMVDSATDSLTPEYIRKLAIFEFVSSLFTLLGALLMFNQRKIGFYVYIAGIIIVIARQFIVGSFIGALGGIGVIIFGVAFIGMYAMNLKCMTK